MIQVYVIGEDGILKELELAGYQYLGGPVCIELQYAKTLLPASLYAFKSDYLAVCNNI